MKKIICFIFILIVFPTTYYAFDFDIYSTNHIMYNMTTNKVISANKENEKVSIASLTKIVTAITTLDLVQSLDDKVTITDETLKGLKEANASVAGFYISQKVTIEDLLYGLMLPSGADAAQALEIYLESEGYNLVEEMNKLVKKLNLVNTNFVNTTGLDEENHYSTAYDISQLLMYALENKNFKKIFTTSTYLTSDTNITLHASYTQIMKRFEIDNKYIIGAKTGYTESAQNCLASITNFNDTHFMLVTLGAPRVNYFTHLIDANNIYKYVENNYDYHLLFKKNEILKYVDVENATVKQYNVKAPTDYYIYAEKNFDKSDYQIKYKGETLLSPKNEIANIGTFDIFYKEKSLLDTIEVSYDGSLKYSVPGFIIENKTQIINITILIGGSLLILIIILKIRNSKSQKKR